MLPEEPPEGLSGVVHLRFRLPDGSRVSRRFLSSDEMSVSACGGFHSPDTLMKLRVYCFCEKILTQSTT